MFNYTIGESGATIYDTVTNAVIAYLPNLAEHEGERLDYALNARFITARLNERALAGV